MAFIKTNINLQDELNKYKDAALWNLEDGIYKIYIKSERSPFRNGEEAVITSRGMISINDLFRFADDSLKILFFKDGDFVLNTEIELEIVMRNKGVVSVKKV